MASVQYDEHAAPDFDDYAPIFYIGQHESKRALPISERVLEKARNIGDTGVSEYTSFWFLAAGRMESGIIA